jgi:hypothetical protein
MDFRDDKRTDSSPVLRRFLNAKVIDSGLLPELVTVPRVLEGPGASSKSSSPSKLESALDEISGSGRSETRQKGACTLGGNDLTEATDEALVVDFWFELDTGLDLLNKKKLGLPDDSGCFLRETHDIDRGESTVSNGAADGTGQSEALFEAKGQFRRRSGQKKCTA